MYKMVTKLVLISFASTFAFGHFHLPEWQKIRSFYNKFYQTKKSWHFQPDDLINLHLELNQYMGLDRETPLSIKHLVQTIQTNLELLAEGFFNSNPIAIQLTDEEKKIFIFLQEKFKISQGYGRGRLSFFDVTTQTLNSNHLPNQRAAGSLSKKVSMIYEVANFKPCNLECLSNYSNSSQLLQVIKFAFVLDHFSVDNGTQQLRCFKKIKFPAVIYQKNLHKVIKIFEGEVLPERQYILNLCRINIAQYKVIRDIWLNLRYVLTSVENSIEPSLESFVAFNQALYEQSNHQIFDQAIVFLQAYTKFLRIQDQLMLIAPNLQLDLKHFWAQFNTNVLNKFFYTHFYHGNDIEKLLQDLESYSCHIEKVLRFSIKKSFTKLIELFVLIPYLGLCKDMFFYQINWFNHLHSAINSIDDVEIDNLMLEFGYDNQELIHEIKQLFQNDGFKAFLENNPVCRPRISSIERRILTSSYIQSPKPERSCNLPAGHFNQYTLDTCGLKAVLEQIQAPTCNQSGLPKANILLLNQARLDDLQLVAQKYQQIKTAFMQAYEIVKNDESLLGILCLDLMTFYGVEPTWLALNYGMDAAKFIPIRARYLGLIEELAKERFEISFAAVMNYPRKETYLYSELVKETINRNYLDLATRKLKISCAQFANNLINYEFTKVNFALQQTLLYLKNSNNLATNLIEDAKVIFSMQVNYNKCFFAELE